MLTFAQGEWRTVSGKIVDYQSIRDKNDVAARDLGFEFRRFEMAKPADLEPLLDAIAQWGADSQHAQGRTAIRRC